MAGIGHNQPPKISANNLSPEQRKIVKKAIQELNDSMTRVAAERDLQKETINTLYDNVGIDKKVVRRMAKAYFKSNFDEEIEDNNEFEDSYTLIVKGENKDV